MVGQSVDRDGGGQHRTHHFITHRRSGAADTAKRCASAVRHFDLGGQRK
jgi:hypothetical protein